MDQGPMTEEPPGCLVILIALSAGMAGDVRVWPAHRSGPNGEPELSDLPAQWAARFLADELIDGLVNTLTAGYAVPLDVAVLGYQTNADGVATILPLLPVGESKLRWVSVKTLAARPAPPRAREGDPRKWVPAVVCTGTAPAAVGLAAVYQMVAMWLTGRFAARPPVVIHCTDGTGLDHEYIRVVRSLGLLTTTYGPPRLLHVGFAPGTEPTLCGQWPAELPEPWARLAELSAELPAEPEGRPTRRAVSVNDWSIADAWSALFDFAPVDAATNWTATDNGRFIPTVRELWTQKMGNAPTEWEDAYTTDWASGVAAVADGASTGIYCRIWADELVKRFVADRPDARDPAALEQWVATLRKQWREVIDYPKLNYFKQRKVDETGAAATLLGLEVGPLDADGNRPWRACAVGDVTLFWIRDGKLLASFPVVAADQFGSAPLLLRSNPGFRSVTLAATGVCRPGDLFLLATDAVANRLLKSHADGPGPDWESFETIDPDAWRKDLDDLRRTKDMVNDDCTLVVLRIAGAEVPVPPPPESAVVVAQPTATTPLIEEPAAPVADAAEMIEPAAPESEAALEQELGDTLAEPDPSPDEPDERPPTAREGFSEPTDTNV